MDNFLKNFYKKPLDVRLKEQGVMVNVRWQTYVDDQVCQICGPCDHKLKDEKIFHEPGGWNGESWGERFPDGPPAHSGCRCQTIVERK
jgi:hypothetical protein